jgi:transposase
MSANNRKRSDVQPQIWIGLDVSKAEFTAAICLDIHQMPTRTFARNQSGAKALLEWCDQMVPDGLEVRFIMEATGSNSIEIFTWLYQLRPQSAPAIVNACYIKHFGQSLGVRNKTDKADAKVIARFGYEREPAGETPKSPEQVNLQELSRERNKLVEERTAEKNRAQEPCSIAQLRQMRKKRVELLTKQIKAIEKQMHALVRQTPSLKHDIKLLMSIPGVGFLSAVTALAELGDLRRFTDPRKLTAFCGLNPREHTSGTSVHRPTRMSKRGNKHVRPFLHLGARSLIGRTQHAMGRLYDSLLARGKTKSAALGVISRKLLVLMRAVLVNNTPYKDELYARGKAQIDLWKNPQKKACAA